MAQLAAADSADSVETITNSLQQLNVGESKVAKDTYSQVAWASCDLDQNSDLKGFFSDKEAGQNGKLYCHHATIGYWGFHPLKPDSDEASNRRVILDAAPTEGSKVRVVVTHFVKCLKTKAIAARAVVVDSDGNEVIVASGEPHITIFVPKGCRPADSLKFVNRADKVRVVELEEAMIFAATVKYKRRN